MCAPFIQRRKTFGRNARALAYEAKIRDMMAVAATNRTDALREKMWLECADRVAWIGTGPLYKGKGNIMCGKSLWEKLCHYRELSLLRGSSQLMQDYVRTLPETGREAFRTNFVHEAGLSEAEARQLFGD